MIQIVMYGKLPFTLLDIDIEFWLDLVEEVLSFTLSEAQPEPPEETPVIFHIQEGDTVRVRGYSEELLFVRQANSPDDLICMSLIGNSYFVLSEKISHINGELVEWISGTEFMKCDSPEEPKPEPKPKQSKWISLESGDVIRVEGEEHLLVYLPEKTYLPRINVETIGGKLGTVPSPRLTGITHINHQRVIWEHYNLFRVIPE